VLVDFPSTIPAANYVSDMTVAVVSTNIAIIASPNCWDSLVRAVQIADVELVQLPDAFEESMTTRSKMEVKGE
jgi:hypothetical protein